MSQAECVEMNAPDPLPQWKLNGMLLVSVLTTAAGVYVGWPALRAVAAGLHSLLGISIATVSVDLGMNALHARAMVAGILLVVGFVIASVLHVRVRRRRAALDEEWL